MSRLRAVCLSLALAALPSVARAERAPDLWDRTRDPEAATRWELHQAATQALLLSQQDPRDLVVRPMAIETARGALRAAPALVAKDPRLAFDLGALEEDRGDHEAAVTVLERALAAAPDHPAAEDAWITLAYAHSKLDHPTREKECYEAYLRLAIEPSSRASARLNHAESEMRTGHLAEAIDGYRIAFEEAQGSSVAGDSDTVTLAVWGLAVALDRAGDPAASAHEVALARKLDPDMELIGVSPHVFFVPAFERHWYLGLGALHDAKNGATRGDRAAGAVRAAAHFLAYERAALASDLGAKVSDPRSAWTPLARAHAAEAQRLAKALGGVRKAATDRE